MKTSVFFSFIFFSTANLFASSFCVNNKTNLSEVNSKSTRTNDLQRHTGKVKTKDNSFSVYVDDKIKLLDDYLKSVGAKDLEGHICRGKTKADSFKKIISENVWIENIAEIGFNAGHSSVVFLDTSPRIKLVSFDICFHPYVGFAKKFVDHHFPGRHSLVKGDSTITVPNYSSALHKFDFIFVDGSHKTEVAIKDIKNMRRLAHKKTILIVDDLQLRTVKKALKFCESEKIIQINRLEYDAKRSWAVCNYLW
jgi:predicted O-methyltransferase YrrM